MKKRIEDQDTHIQAMQNSNATEISKLRLLLASSKEAKADTQAELNEVKAELVDLKTQIKGESITSTSHEPKRSAKLPDVEEYWGERSKYRAWINNLKTKFVANGDHFPIDKLKMLYAFGRMRGTAAERAAPMIDENGDPEWKNLKAFYDWCDVKFGDPDAASTAKRIIQETKMGDREFSVYISEICARQKESKFDDETMKYFVKQNIHDKLKWNAMHHKEPEEFDKYCDLLQRLDNKRIEISTTLNSMNRRGGLSSRGNLRGGYVSQGPSRVSSFSNSTLSRISSPALSIVSSDTAAPVSTPLSSLSVAPLDSISNFDRMDLDSVSGSQPGMIFKGPVPPRVKEARRSEGACGYCGIKGHNSSACKKFICGNCKQPGHGYSQCPEPRKQRIYETTLVSEPLRQEGKEEPLG